MGGTRIKTKALKQSAGLCCLIVMFMASASKAEMYSAPSLESLEDSMAPLSELDRLAVISPSGESSVVLVEHPHNVCLLASAWIYFCECHCIEYRRNKLIIAYFGST